MKPTPTHHLIHWLNNHPTPHENIPGTAVRIADAHDHLVETLADSAEELENLKGEFERLEEHEASAAARLDRIVFRVKHDLDRIINLGTTGSDTADQLEGLLAFVEENE